MKQALFSVRERNRGYCFVTYASEYDAKKALIKCASAHFNHGHLHADLKLNSTHIDWDAEIFNEFMEVYEYQS